MKKVNLEYTNIPLLLPDINYFIDKVKNNQPFHFLRVNHGVWDLIYFAYKNRLNEFNKDYQNKDFDKISKIVQNYHTNNRFYKHDSGEGMTYWHKNSDKFSEFFTNLLEVIYDYNANEKYKIGLSTGVGLHTEFGVWGETHEVQIGRTNIVKSIIDTNTNSEDFFYSGIIKHYAIMGEVSKLIELLNENEFMTIFLGNHLYSEFHNIYNIKNFKHIEIPPTGAMDTFDDYIDKILDIHSNNNKIFIFHSCGHILSAYLAKKIKHTNIYAIDVGKSFELDIANLMLCKNDWFNPNGISNPKERYTSYIKKLRNG